MRKYILIFAVLSFTAPAYATTVTLQWDAVAATDLDHYTVYVAEKYLDTTGPWTKDQDVPAGTTTATVTVTTGKHHAFYVTATDSSGNESQASNIAGTSDRVPPPGPENNRVTDIAEP